MNSIPIVLTIAGSDSSAGAGIQADLKTFMALNVYGTTAVTSITAQNTNGISQVYHLPAQIVYQQIKSISDDFEIAAAKTGMLSNNEIVLSVSKAIEEIGINKLVIDPVINAKDGTYLLEENSLEIFKEKILPLSLVVTPNKFEAEILSGIKIYSKEDIIESAMKIFSLGPKYVVIKGGHIDTHEKVIDLIYSKDKFEFIENTRIKTKNTHGIGCTFSAAITAFIAKNFDVIDAIKKARLYVQNALKSEINIGKGFGPLNHRWLWKE